MHFVFTFKTAHFPWGEWHLSAHVPLNTIVEGALNWSIRTIYIHLVTNMEARKLCLVHGRELLSLICNDCTVPLCSECLTSSHNRHNITGITDIVLQHRELLYNTLTNDKTPSHLNVLRTTVSESLANLVSDSEKAEEDINLETDRIIEEAEQYRHYQLEKFATMTKKREIPLQQLNMQIKQFDRYMDQAQQEVSWTGLDGFTDMDIVVLGLDLTTVLKTKESNTRFSAGTFVFEATGDLHISQDVMGSVTEEHALMSDSDSCMIQGNKTACDDVKESEDETFYDCVGIPDVLVGTVVFSRTITSITPRSSQCSLVLSDGKLYEVTQPCDKQIKKTCQVLASNVKQVCRAPDGNMYALLFSNASQHSQQQSKWCIKKILPDNRIVSFCQLGCLHAACIGLTTEYDIAVFMIQTNSKGYSHVLIVLDRNGLVKTNTKYSVEHYNPHCVLCLENNDVFISISNEVLLLSRCYHRKLMSRYVDNLRFHQSKTLVCSGMCFDPYGNILLCIQNENSIHLLNKDGRFLRLLMTEKDGIMNPLSLSCDNIRRLWIGCEDGKVFIVDYNTLYHSK